MRIRTNVIGTHAVEAYLDTEYEKKYDALLRVMTKLGLQLRGIVVDDKLSGQVLKRRTGNLARSVIDESPQVDEEATKITSAVGFNERTTPYGKFHEFGVNHSWVIEAKRAKALRFKLGGSSKFSFAKRVTHPGLPERSFLRSSLTDISPRVAPTIASDLGGQPG